MRGAVAVIAVAACATPGEDQPDARPGQVDGAWAVTWTCVALCMPEPAILRTQRVVVTAGALVWDAPACADCRLEHTGVARGDCLDVAAGADNANDERDAYSLCATGPSTVRAEVGVRRTGGTGRTARWQVDGVRRP